MSTRVKNRAVGLLLALCVVWPPIHHALAVHYEFDPWRFFGWSMYAVPAPYVEVTMAELIDGQLNVIERSSELRVMAKDYADRRATLGRLLPPDHLADAIFAERPHIDGVAILVRRWVLDPRSGMTEYRDQQYNYRPPQDSRERLGQPARQ